MDAPPNDPDSPPLPTTSDHGVVEEVSPQAVFNYSFLGSGQQEEIILRDRIAIGCWSTFGLSVRTHGYRGSSGARFIVIVRGTAPSPSDGADFVTADLATITLAGSAPNLQQLTVPLTGLQVPYLRVVLRAQGPTSPPGDVYCEISCDLIAKAG